LPSAARARAEESAERNVGILAAEFTLAKSLFLGGSFLTLEATETKYLWQICLGTPNISLRCFSPTVYIIQFNPAVTCMINVTGCVCAAKNLVTMAV
jgi:hypothetical protein